MVRTTKGECQCYFFDILIARNVPKVLRSGKYTNMVILLATFLKMRDNCLISLDARHLIKMRDCPAVCVTGDSYELSRVM